MLTIATVSEKPDSNSPYPCLKITNEGLIVLFSSLHAGTVIHCANADYTVGEYSHSWIKDNFEPYYGEVSISND